MFPRSDLGNRENMVWYDNIHFLATGVTPVVGVGFVD